MLSKVLPEREYPMNNKKIIAMMMTLSMLAAAFAGCLGGDDDEGWELTAADDVSAVFVTSEWDPIIPNLNAGEMCDALLSSMTKTDTREEVVDFTRGYYTSSIGVIGAADAAVISDPLDLNVAGTVVAVQASTTSDLWASGDGDDPANLPDATILAFPMWPDVIAAIENGDAHYAMGDSPVLAVEGDLMVTFSEETFGMAVAEEGSDLLLDALNVAITAVIDSGEYDLIFGQSFEGSVVLTDDTTADTATSYPMATEGSRLAHVLETGELKLCSDTTYPPFESLNADGDVVGFSADLAHAIADELAAHYMGNENPTFTPDTVIKIGVLYDREVALTDFAPAFDWAFAEAFADLNAMDDGYHFKMIYASTKCSEEGGAQAAQSVLDAGVVAVAGAACSGASMGANSILAPAGIPMLSYASTSPTLSDSTTYPDFYRVAPSDELQGKALADLVASQGYTSTAVLSMNNDYGSGVASAFETNFNAMDGNSVCVRYDFNNDEFSGSTVEEALGAMASASETCDSVLLATYSPAGAQLIGGMYLAGSSLPAFGPDGMAGLAALDSFANPALSNGMMVTNPRSGTSAGDFAQRCSDNTICAGGIFTLQAYDSVMMIGMAAKMDDGNDMKMHLPMVGAGDGYAGASGNHIFMANGDIPGDGYDVCSFNHVPTYGDYFNCQHKWSVTDGLEAAVFEGITIKIGFMGDASSPAISELWPSFQTSATIANNLANTIGWSNNVQFEIVFADDGCNGFESTSTGASAAQSLVDAGVWGVVGGACSGASMAANAILSPAGIPMISYASTSADLSDATAYPDFFRVVPSDAGQAAAVKDIMMHNNETMAADGGVAILAASDDYTAALADGFTEEWIAAGGEICTRNDYARPVTDYTLVAAPVIDNACGSVALFAYNSDGAGLISELKTQNFAGQIYGTDGIASVTTAGYMQDDLLDGVIATNIATADDTEVGMILQSLWPSTVPMGQFAMEAFDAYTIMAFSAFTQLSSGGPSVVSSSAAIGVTGVGWNGATGPISFLANGDTPGNGYCIGQFTVTDIGADGEGVVNYDCTHTWGAEGLTEVSS